MERETQQTITRWAEDTFGETHPASIARRMGLEVLELLEGFEAAGDEPVGRMPRDVVEALQEECGDIYIMLSQIAEKLGADLAAVADDKMRVNRTRRWAYDPVSGTTRHVEECSR